MCLCETEDQMFLHELYINIAADRVQGFTLLSHFFQYVFFFFSEKKKVI